MRETSPGFVSIPGGTAKSFSITGDGGIRLTVYRFAGAPAGAPILLWGHAGGFTAGSYLPLLEALSHEAEIFAFDARGHGGSGVPQPEAESGAEPPYDPDRFARDLAAIAAFVATQTGGRPIHYAAHSLNAAAFLRLGCCFPALFGTIPWRRALLFEPPLFPPRELPIHDEAAAKNKALVARTRLRRRHWRSPEDFADYLKDRGVFASFAATMRVAHARAALQPAPDGQYVLACPPEVEAAMYAAFTDPSTYALLPRFPHSVMLRLVSGDPDTGPSRDWVTAIAGFAAERLDAPLSILPGLGHLMVFEDPGQALDLVRKIWRED